MRHRSLTPGDSEIGAVSLSDPVVTSLQSSFADAMVNSNAGQPLPDANERALLVLSQAVESLRTTVETQAASQENLQSQLSRLQSQQRTTRSVPATPEATTLPESKLRELAKRQSNSPVFTALAKVQTVVNMAELDSGHSSDSTNSSNTDASYAGDAVDEVFRLPYSHVGDSHSVSSSSPSTQTVSVTSSRAHSRRDITKIYEKMIAQLQTQLPALERTVQQQLSDNFRLSVDKEEALMALSNERQTVVTLRDTCERYQQEYQLLADRLAAQQTSNDSMQHSLARLDALHSQVSYYTITCSHKFLFYNLFVLHSKWLFFCYYFPSLAT